jgi:hypothetical protein
MRSLLLLRKRSHETAFETRYTMLFDVRSSDLNWLRLSRAAKAASAGFVIRHLSTA